MLSYMTSRAFMNLKGGLSNWLAMCSIAETVSAMKEIDLPSAARTILVWSGKLN
jgi:hypothetical protein